jgi:hypothetical protein
MVAVGGVIVVVVAIEVNNQRKIVRRGTQEKTKRMKTEEGVQQRIYEEMNSRDRRSKDHVLNRMALEI